MQTSTVRESFQSPFVCYVICMTLRFNIIVLQILVIYYQNLNLNLKVTLLRRDVYISWAFHPL
jgi:hypothetical protein